MGKVLKVGKKPVEEKITFIPEKADGSVDVAFRWDGSTMSGKTVVVFETLRYNDAVIAVHEDLQDEKQSVTIPGDGSVAGESVDKGKGPIKKGRPGRVAGAVKTGDTGNLAFWTGMCLVSAAIVIVLWMRRRKGRRLS